VSEPVSEGSIYDLGYRRYDGSRLGRRATFLAIYVSSVRGAFGLGRRTTAKIVPFALAVLVFVPALIQLGVAALTSGGGEGIDLVTHEDYFGYVQLVLILFCAAVASELVGRDQRNRTLALYFSRGVSRADYPLAKIAALTTAMAVLTLGAQLLLFVGNGLAGEDLGGYVGDNLDLVPRIVGASLMLSLVIAASALAVASYVPRRSYATAAIVGLFIVSAAAAEILMETVDVSVARFALLASPATWEGFVYWIFGSDPPRSSSLDDADFAGSVYVIAGLAMIALGVGLCIRRFRRIAA
jgi:ABC-2 type transport system permease protein